MSSHPTLDESRPSAGPAVFGLNDSGDPADDARRILEAALALLTQGEELLRSLTTETYGQRVPQVFNASIGGHYRHCLDHFSTLLSAAGAETVDYDQRERDVRVETQPDFALSLTRNLQLRIACLSLTTMEMPLRTRCEVSYAEGNSPVTRSTFGREMVYAIAHAIHHYALISVMGRVIGIELPERFGLAPSTALHQANRAGR